MLIVSNTSPVSNLAVIDRLDLLKSRYGSLIIPPAVARELRDLSHPAAKQRVVSALNAGWLKVMPLPPEALAKMPVRLDPGETEAIALAGCFPDAVLLIDERRGREEARKAGLAIGGVLGELLFAKHTGGIECMLDAIKRLRVEAGFFLSREIEMFILSQAGE